MTIQWSDFALASFEEIIIWYELEAGRQVADSVQNRIWQQVQDLRKIDPARRSDADSTGVRQGGTTTLGRFCVSPKVEKIDGFPMSLPASELFPGTRKLVISNLPYVAFIRQLNGAVWEVVDVVHTARKFPKTG